MEIDIEALVAEWKQQQEKIILTIDERKERLVKRNRENGELYEQAFRRKVSLIAKCVARYDPSRLHDWFLLDHWTVKDGLILLCGFEPKNIPHDEEGQLRIPSEHNYVQNLGIEQIRRLDHLPVYDPLTAKILGKSHVQNINWAFRSTHCQLLRIWNSGYHTETRYPPKYFIDWAIKKGHSIEWLEWAKAHNYYQDAPGRLGPPALAAGPTAADTWSPASATAAARADVRPAQGNITHPSAVPLARVPDAAGGDISGRSETSYLHILGALLDLYWNVAHQGEEYKQVVVLNELKKYEGFPGMSERNLKDKLTKARNAIKS